MTTMIETDEQTAAANAPVLAAEAHFAALSARLAAVSAEAAELESELATGRVAPLDPEVRERALLEGAALPAPIAAAKQRLAGLVAARLELQAALARATDAASLERRRYADRLLSGPMAARVEAIRAEWLAGLRLLISAARAEATLLADVDAAGADAPPPFATLLPTIDREAVLGDAAAVLCQYDKEFAAAEAARERADTDLDGQRLLRAKARDLSA